MNERFRQIIRRLCRIIEMTPVTQPGVVDQADIAEGAISDICKLAGCWAEQEIRAHADLELAQIRRKMKNETTLDAPQYGVNHVGDHGQRGDMHF